VDSHGNESVEEVDMMAVYEEFDKVCVAHKLGEVQTKPVTRKYAFELPGIPASAEYLKVAYSYSSKTTREFGPNGGKVICI